MSDPAAPINLPLKDAPARTWRAWAKGLGVAIVGGAVNALILSIVEPHMMYEAIYTGDLALLKAAVATGLFKGLLYLKASPLPGD